MAASLGGARKPISSPHDEPQIKGRDMMEKKQLWSMLALAILAGFVGGAVASRVFTLQPVFAAKKSNPGRLIEAQALRIVDEDGNLRILLGNRPEDQGPHLLMVDKSGSNIELGLAYGNPGLALTRGSGRITLGTKRGIPTLSLRYLGRTRTWTVPTGRP